MGYRKLLLTLCGILEAVISITFLTQGTALLGKLTLAAAACALAAGLWRGSTGRSWLLVLNGLALGTLGVIFNSLFRYRVSFRTIALLLAVMALSDKYARVGEQHESVNLRIVAWPRGPARAVRIASLRKLNPITDGEIAHGFIGPRHLIADECRRQIEGERNFEGVLRALQLTALPVGDISEAVEPDRLARARHLFRKVSGRLDQRAVGKDLLLQFVDRLVAVRIVETPRLLGIRPEVGE